MERRPAAVQFRDRATGDEAGYFHFGGSTFVMVLEPGRIRFDSDLVDASSGDLETFLKFGTKIGERAG